MIFFIAFGWPGRRRHHRAEDTPMPVSQDVTDFCADLTAKVAAKVQAATADEQARFDALTAQIQQDHADEVAALKTALDAATS